MLPTELPCPIVDVTGIPALRIYFLDFQAALEEKRFHHAAYAGLEDFVERFGARPSGSDQLEAAIDFMKQKAEHDGFRVSGRREL